MPEVTTAKFNDYLGMSLKSATELTKVLHMERSQLYQSLIQLMINTNTDSFQIVAEDSKNIRETYSIEFRPDEEGKTAQVVLVKHDPEVLDEQIS